MKVFFSKRILILVLVNTIALFIYEMRVSSYSSIFVHDYDFSFSLLIFLFIFAYCITILVDLFPVKARKFINAFIIVLFGILCGINSIYISLKSTIVTLDDLALAQDGAAFLDMTKGILDIAYFLELIVCTAAVFIVQAIVHKDMKYSKPNVFKYAIGIVALVAVIIYNFSLNNVNYLNATKYANDTSSINAGIFYGVNKSNSISQNSNLDGISSYSDDETFGIFEDKNVVLIMVESLGHNVIDEEIHPTLYYMKENGINFSNYTPQTLGTGESEFQVLTSLSPSKIEWEDPVIPNVSIPSVLNEHGYHTIGAHNNLGVTYRRMLTYPKFGFDQSIFSDSYDFDTDVSGPLNGKGHKGDVTVHIDDYEFMKELKNEITADEKFFLHFLTISSHASYSSEHIKVGDHPDRQFMYEGVEMANELYPDNDEGYNNYLGMIKSTDRAVEELIEDLQAKEMYEDTVFLVMSDHYPYGLDSGSFQDRFGTSDGLIDGASNLYMSQFENEFDKYKVDFFIYSPIFGTGGVEIEDHVNSVDVPVILSYLLGIENQFYGDNPFDDSADHFNDMKGANNYSIEYEDLYYDGNTFECWNLSTNTLCNEEEEAKMQEFIDYQLSYIATSDSIIAEVDN